MKKCQVRNVQLRSVLFFSFLVGQVARGRGEHALESREIPEITNSFFEWNPNQGAYPINTQLCSKPIGRWGLQRLTCYLHLHPLIPTLGAISILWVGGSRGAGGGLPRHYATVGV